MVIESCCKSIFCITRAHRDRLLTLIHLHRHRDRLSTLIHLHRHRDRLLTLIHLHRHRDRLLTLIHFHRHSRRTILLFNILVKRKEFYQAKTDICGENYKRIIIKFRPIASGPCWADAIVRHSPTSGRADGVSGLGYVISHSKTMGRGSVGPVGRSPTKDRWPAKNY